MNSSPAQTDRETWIDAAIASGDIVTPCLLLDLDAVDSVLAKFKKHLPGVNLFYSMKANNDPALLRYLHSRGVGFDVASINEIRSALDAGASANELILSNTVKTPSCVREIFRRRVSATTVDNEQDVNALALESTFHTFRPKIFARIKVLPVGVDINLNEKFGCTPDVAVQLLTVAHEKGLPAEGVHFHVGTQCRNTQSYRESIDTAIEVLDAVNGKTGLQLDTINIGGGFPDELVAAAVGGLDQFLAELGLIVKDAQSRGFVIVAEPGRVIASGAGIAISQVIARNNHEGSEWIYLDDGIYGLFSTAYYEKRKFQFVPIGHAGGKLKPFVVAGPTCDSLDVVDHNAMLPCDINVGDYVVAYQAGAYSISVKSNFNGLGQISTAIADRAVVSSDEHPVPRAIAGA